MHDVLYKISRLALRLDVNGLQYEFVDTLLDAGTQERRKGVSYFPTYTHFRPAHPIHSLLRCKIVLIHGLSIPSLIWKDVALALAREGFRVLLYGIVLLRNSSAVSD